MQCLAEDRWEDYYWQYETERFAYWGPGISWIENRELDPLGLQIMEYHSNMTTIPDRDSDLSFYLQKSDPIPLESSTSTVEVATGADTTNGKVPAQPMGSEGSDSGVGMSCDGEPGDKTSQEQDGISDKPGDVDFGSIVVPV